MLRIYRDTLTADMKAAFKAAINELLPALVARSLGSDFVPGERMMNTDGRSSNMMSIMSSSRSPLRFYLEDILFLVSYVEVYTLSGSSLADKLKSLSPECFLELLSAIFMVVQVMHLCL